MAGLTGNLVGMFIQLVIFHRFEAVTGRAGTMSPLHYVNPLQITGSLVISAARNHVLAGSVAGST